MEKEIFTISVLLAFMFNKTGAQDISDLLDGYDAYNRYRGNILVAQNGKIILQQSFGYADKDRDIKNDSSTLFNLASVTKTITAAAIFKLHDEGRLNVFDRVDKDIPEFINDETDSITIINLLNHTSGVVNPPEGFTLSEHEPVTQEQTISQFMDTKLKSGPGTAAKDIQPYRYGGSSDSKVKYDKQNRSFFSNAGETSFEAVKSG